MPETVSAVLKAFQWGFHHSGVNLSRWVANLHNRLRYRAWLASCLTFERDEAGDLRRPTENLRYKVPGTYTEMVPL